MSIAENDDRFLGTAPSLITIGFTPRGNSSTLPSLYVKATLRNLTVPDGAVSIGSGGYTQQAISGLTFTAFGELLIQDSLVDNVTSIRSSEMISFGAIKVVGDTRMRGSAVLRVVNSSFQNVTSSKACSALDIQGGNA